MVSCVAGGGAEDGAANGAAYKDGSYGEDGGTSEIESYGEVWLW